MVQPTPAFPPTKTDPSLCDNSAVFACLSPFTPAPSGGKPSLDEGESSPSYNFELGRDYKSGQDYIELAGVEVGTRTSPQEGVEILTLSNYIPTTNYFSSLNLRHIYCQFQSSMIKHGKISVY